MEIKHTVGENQKLYNLLRIDSGEHNPATEQLCEIIRNMMICQNCDNELDSWGGNLCDFRKVCSIETKSSSDNHWKPEEWINETI